MVFLEGTSPITFTKCEVSLLKRATSLSTTSNDLMNTAFYEPDYDFDFELEKNAKTQAINEPEPDPLEILFDNLTARYPFLMLQFVPLLIQLLLILLITFVVFISGISDFSNKCAARLYYFLLCCIF